jgi:hypothetical protein
MLHRGHWGCVQHDPVQVARHGEAAGRYHGTCCNSACTATAGSEVTVVVPVMWLSVEVCLESTRPACVYDAVLQAQQAGVTLPPLRMDSQVKYGE